ncbi:MAG: tRNA(Ile)-lysidine synthase [Candidatus Dependentiae bacterium ADurb.Bin331]|nr:MAG: tRNA(Ile)-lysidine synthase [Candidatus Dependentiae bacterium ADurb.Bin331]
MHNDSLFQQISDYCEKNKLLPSGSSVVVGLSGGPDSVFLLHFLKHYQQNNQLTLIAAHLNHEWRTAADADQQFCADLAQRFNISFHTKKISQLPVSIKHNGSKEENARNYRRFFLESVAQEYGATAIALGHHANDQQETFFIRLLRGTTLSGLTGMKPKKDFYIRPLLDVRKEEIVQFLDTHKITYCIDETNDSPTFLRNRIRNDVIPALKLCDSRFETQFSRTISMIQQTEQFLEQLTEKTFSQIAYQENGSWYLNTQKLKTYDEFLQHRIIVHWLVKEQIPFVLTEQFVDEIMRFFVTSEKKTHQIHHAWKIKFDNSTCAVIVKI